MTLDHSLEPVIPEHELLALSPIDGRYAAITRPFQDFCSEYALIRYRLRIEISWFNMLAGRSDVPELKPPDDADKLWLDQLVEQFSIIDARRVKAFEAVTNHDVKAVEYFLKEQMATRKGFVSSLEFVHFACTSEDINNLSYALMLRDCRTQVLLPAMERLLAQLTSMAEAFAGEAMLARTHGQAASPTTMGKELANTAARLKRQLTQFQTTEILGKMNGAVGNYNAHLVAYPKLDWPAICQQFVESLGIGFNPCTTQIEPHDYIAEYCQILGRFNRILTDCNRDIWGYISLGYFSQQPEQHETGSSTMPHKVNPIHFENSEGNLAIADGVFSCLANQLTVSRWQRDLKDSTMLRNLGIGLAHSFIGWQASLKGLRKLRLSTDRLQQDLNEAWEVLAEPIQTLMRRYGIPKPYEQLKDLTRGLSFNQANMRALIEKLDLPETAKQTLVKLRPEDYTGLAAEIAAGTAKKTIK